MNKLMKSLVSIGIFLLSTSAFAHSGHIDSFGFISGFLHPLTGWDHFLTILLVSFWSVFALKKIWLGPVKFIGGMFLGAFLGLAHFTIVWFELGISLSIIGMGFLIYFNQRFNFNIVFVLIAVFGIFYGYAHSDYLGNVNNSSALIIADLCGLMIATSLLHAIGLFLGKKVIDFNTLAYRGVGICAALIGLWSASF